MSLGETGYLLFRSSPQQPRSLSSPLFSPLRTLITLISFSSSQPNLVSIGALRTSHPNLVSIGALRTKVVADLEEPRREIKISYLFPSPLSRICNRVPSNPAMEASETAESIHLSDDTEEAIHLSDTEEAIHLSDTEDNETDEPIDLEVSWEDVLDYRKLTVEDVMAKTFKTLEEAEKFYYSYALAIGFGPRRDTRGGLFEGKLRRRQWVCNKQGYRDKKWLDRETDGSGRNRRKLTRQGCMAKFRVNYMVDEGYYAVRAFDEDHSHQCANPRQAAFIRSHRNVDEAALGNTNTMTKISI
ncbi:hypothetical protein ACLB2K_031934 [Fragaria x ananassa]